MHIGLRIVAKQIKGEKQGRGVWDSQPAMKELFARRIWRPSFHPNNLFRLRQAEDKEREPCRRGEKELGPTARNTAGAHVKRGCFLNGKESEPRCRLSTSHLSSSVAVDTEQHIEANLHRCILNPVQREDVSRWNNWEGKMPQVHTKWRILEQWRPTKMTEKRDYG